MNQTTNISSNEPPERQYIIDLIQGWENKNSQDKNDVLTKIRSLEEDKVIDILNTMLYGSDIYLQSYSIDVLMLLDKHRGIDLILPLLKSPEARLRWFICDLLTDEGDERAVQPLSKVLLEDPDSNVRLKAVVALNCIGDPSAIPALQNAVEFDKGEDDGGRQINKFAKDAIDSIRQRSKS